MSSHSGCRQQNSKRARGWRPRGTLHGASIERIQSSQWTLKGSARARRQQRGWEHAWERASAQPIGDVPLKYILFCTLRTPAAYTHMHRVVVPRPSRSSHRERGAAYARWVHSHGVDGHGADIGYLYARRCFLRSLVCTVQELQGALNECVILMAPSVCGKLGE